MMNNVFNEGARGLQNAQRELQRSASDIARVNTTATAEVAPESVQTTLQPVARVEESANRSLEESIIELRRQEQLFSANAKVISVADNTLGSLIDVRS